MVNDNIVTRNDSDRFRVDILDVGQGDSIVVEEPTGGVMVVDSGPWYDDGNTVIEYCDERGINYIDCLAATHDDADHIGGHKTIIEEFGPDRIGAVRGPERKGINTKNPSKAKTQYDTALKNNGMEEKELGEGDSFELDAVDIDVLNPSSDINDESQNLNSLVLQVGCDEQSVLLTGDVEGVAETRLSQQYPDRLNQVDVLKSPHHGAASSSESTPLDKTSPESLIISSSLNNQYTDTNEHDGHPHDAMLKRVHDREDDIEIYWTPVHGKTSVIIENREVQIEPDNERAALLASDVAALKYYGRANDVAKDQLAEIEQIDPTELPGETPKWACGAHIVDTDKTFDEATEQSSKPASSTITEEAERDDATADEQQATIKELEERLETEQEKNEELEEENEELEEENEYLRQENEKKDEAIEAFSEDRKKKRETIERLEGELEEAKEEIENQKQDNEKRRESTSPDPNSRSDGFSIK